VTIPLPPPLLRQEQLRVERAIDPQSGQVVSCYVNKATGQRIETLSPTYHLLGPNAGYIPPPVSEELS
jgi:hypothetical protein